MRERHPSALRLYSRGVSPHHRDHIIQLAAAGSALVSLRRSGPWRWPSCVDATTRCQPEPKDKVALSPNGVDICGPVGRPPGAVRALLLWRTQADEALTTSFRQGRCSEDGGPDPAATAGSAATRLARLVLSVRDRPGLPSQRGMVVPPQSDSERRRATGSPSRRR